jgi:hypothetical protein
MTRFEVQNYIFDQLTARGDALITLLASTPVSTLLAPGANRIEYTSPKHIELGVFLHKLGLRGVSRW